MSGIGALIILTIIIMVIAWIGNGISDRISDFFRNESVRHENATKPVVQENLIDRYK